MAGWPPVKNPYDSNHLTPNMNQSFKLISTIFLTAIATFAVTAYFTKNDTIKTAVVFEMEAFNAVGRIEAWDRVELFIAQDCNNEALELVKIEQSKALSSLKYNIGADASLLKKIEERNPLIAKRAYATREPTPRTPVCN